MSDRYRYFRVEGREIVDELGRGLMRLEAGDSGASLVAALLRHAHTLKGAARVVRQPAIADLAHAIEDSLAPFRDLAEPLPRSVIERTMANVRTIETHLGSLDQATSSPIPVSQGAPELTIDPFQGLVTDVEGVDQLLAAIGEAEGRIGALRTRLASLARARALTDVLADECGTSAPTMRALVDELGRLLGAVQRDGQGDLEAVEREVGGVHASARALKLAPSRLLFPALERTARDAARMSDVAVEFEGVGGDIRIEANVITAVHRALLQLVRNAVAHGIEPAAERMNHGKPPKGTVKIEVRREGSSVMFICRDDGRGINFEAVRRAAEARGIVTTGDRDSVLAALLGGGISTATHVSQLAGRGIGLDVVATVARDLAGRVTANSTPGLGTEILIELPAVLSSMAAVLVSVNGDVYAIPLQAVRSTRTKDAGRPSVGLAEILGMAADRPARTVVEIECAGRSASLDVERVVGIETVVVSPLPSDLARSPAVAAVSLDATGDPRLVLDAAALIASIPEGFGQSVKVAAAPVSILVIDDSLTTRMLQQSILEAAGYAPHLASSAEEGLDRARAFRYALFLVDVEMPGMDGFEFVQRVRADPTLSAVPIIMVSSRAAPADLRRADEVGANAYVVKGRFDQGQLLATIRRLLHAGEQ